MAVPGFSVSDLIQALGQAKMVYDAFFNEYTSSASQVRDLADDIEQFRKNLQKHKEIVDRRGLECSGYEAVQRTLESCYRFLNDYKEVLDKRRRKSVVGAFKTARFAFEQDEVNRLRGQISRHESSIILSSVNLVLEQSLNSRETSSPNVVAIPVPIPGQSPHSVSPLPTPPLLGSPLLSHDSFSPMPQPTYSSFISERPIPPLFESPQILPRTQSTTLRLSSQRGSPAHQSLAGTSQNGLSIPGLVLPQSALPYCVAEVYFGTKKVELKRKAVGRDSDSGREMIIIQEDGKLRFRHRIKKSRTEPCYPYTWHRRWRKEHNALEIGFKGTTPEAHSISFKGMPPIATIPMYIFTEPKDFEDFQSELRGKQLEATFEVRQILCAASSKNGEATDQHLKIWRDHLSQEFSISYYASNILKPRHMEFPLAMLEQQLTSKGDVEVLLGFIGAGEQKRARTFSRAFSRSPTERSTSSASTTVPGVFTRNNTGITSSASSVTTSNSRMSIASSQSDSSLSQPERSKTESSIDSQVKQMKYLRIEFSDNEEASQFKQTYNRLYQEETSRPIDFFLNWQTSAGSQKTESVISISPSGTPFTMSPELRPIRNRAPTLEG